MRVAAQNAARRSGRAVLVRRPRIRGCCADRVRPMDAEREQVAAASRQLAAERLVHGTAGNVSARGDDGLVAITPTGAVLAELQPEQVSVVDMDGKLVD